jgi:hypothetical protein
VKEREGAGVLISNRTMEPVAQEKGRNKSTLSSYTKIILTPKEKIAPTAISLHGIK